MPDDTVVTPVLEKAAKSWRMWAPYAGAAIVSLYSLAIAFGHRQADTEMTAQSFSEFRTEMKDELKAIHGEVRQLSDGQIETNGKLDSVNDKVDDFKNWKDRVTGVAETVTVPKLQGHRTRK